MKPGPQLIERSMRPDGIGTTRHNTPLLPVPVYAFAAWNRRIREWVQA